ncbi:MAG: glycosyltransferase family 39 protein, partial [Terriglobales bacterium]
MVNNLQSQANPGNQSAQLPLAAIAPEQCRDSGSAEATSAFAVRAFLVAAISLLFVLAVCHFRYGIEADEFENLQFSWLLGHGLIPYAQFFQNHPPLFHFILSFFTRNLVSISESVLLGMRLAAFGIATFVVAGVYNLARQMVPRITAAWCACLFVVLCPFCTKFVELRADWLAEACLVWAMLILARIKTDKNSVATNLRALFVGLLFGIAFGCTQKALALIAGPIFWLCGTTIFAPDWKERIARLRVLSLSLAGLAAGTALFILPLLFNSAFPAFLTDTIFIGKNFPRSVEWTAIWPELMPCSMGIFALSMAVALVIMTRFRQELSQASTISLVVLI